MKADVFAVPHHGFSHLRTAQQEVQRTVRAALDLAGCDFLEHGLLLGRHFIQGKRMEPVASKLGGEFRRGGPDYWLWTYRQRMFQRLQLRCLARIHWVAIDIHEKRGRAVEPEHAEHVHDALLAD